MKVMLPLLLLFIYGPAHAQRSLLTGQYEHDPRRMDDTGKYIFMSIDSVKEVNILMQPKKQDMWLQTKCGIWEITKKGVYGHYYVTLKFGDGTEEELMFSPSYNKMPASDTIPPDRYSPHTDNRKFSSYYGKNGELIEAAKQYRGRKAGI